MKLGQWMIMLSAMIVFISLIGIDIPVLNEVTNATGININNGQVINADLESSNIWTKLFTATEFELFGQTFQGGVLILLLGGSVIIGLFARGYDPGLAILPFLVIVAGLYASTFWAVIGFIKAQEQVWATAIVTMFMGTIGIGFVMSIINYFTGRQ